MLDFFLSMYSTLLSVTNLLVLAYLSHIAPLHDLAHSLVHLEHILAMIKNLCALFSSLTFFCTCSSDFMLTHSHIYLV